MKRATVDNPFCDRLLDTETFELHSADPGAALREFVVLAYSTQKVVTAAFVGELCKLISDAGGQGVKDLSFSNGRKASQHLKLVLARDFGDPDLDYVQTPIYTKRSASRSSISMPVQLPSKIFSRELEDHIDPTSSTEPDENACNFDCEMWRNSPLRKQTSVHRHVHIYLLTVQIRPVCFAVVARTYIHTWRQ